MRWYWAVVISIAIIIGIITYVGLGFLVTESVHKKVVEKGDRVSVWYYGYIYYGSDRRIFDTNIKSVADDNSTYPKAMSFKYPSRFEPLNFTVGKGQMIAGFEEGIIGMHEGSTRLIVVPPEKGYAYDFSKVKNISRTILVPVIETITIGDFEKMFNGTPYEGARYIEKNYGWPVLVADFSADEIKIIREVSVGSIYYPYKINKYYISVESISDGMIRAKIYSEENVYLPDGGIVKEVGKEYIVIDYNMEVAGKTLYFIVRVVYIGKS